MRFFTKLSLSFILACAYSYIQAQCYSVSNVTATPNTFCVGQTVQLSATTSGTGIEWYDAPFGGTLLGTSTSGGNFAVTPTDTTTYYAFALGSDLTPISDTFEFTGSTQMFIVPEGITDITIDAYGAQGNSNVQGIVGGLGGYATGSLSVNEGDTLYIEVGGGGIVSTTGGYNGGGNAGLSTCIAAQAGGGGGASDVRYVNGDLNSRIIIAAGGGGAGGNRVATCGRGTGGGGGGGYYGGGGGAAWPSTSLVVPTGGTQSTGGIGGTSAYVVISGNNGYPGSVGLGGNGGNEVNSNQAGNQNASSGGSGGGLIGNNGSYATTFAGQSGAGGSSYIGSVGDSLTLAWQRSGNGLIIISYMCGEPRVPVTLTPGGALPPSPSISFTNPNTTADSITVCTGTQVTLSCTTLDVEEYLWYKNGIAVNYQNGGSGTYTINTASVGVDEYSLSVVYAGIGCLSSDSNRLVVNKVSPSVSITPMGATSYCVNNPTTLQATPGMNSYLWKRSTNIVAIGSSAYSPIVSGNHSVTVTNAQGCSKTSAWTNVTVYPLPAANAGADKTICFGSDVQIGGANNIANTYAWSPTAGLVNPSVSNPICSPANYTTYTVTVTNNTTGCSKTDAVNVSVNPIPPTPSITSVVNGSNVTFTANSPLSVKINWYKNASLLLANQAPNSSLTVPLSNPAQAYTIKSINSNGCLSSFSNYLLAKLGDEKEGDMLISYEDSGLQAYPNPTTGLLHVAINKDNISSAKLTIYNNLGQEVYSQAVEFVSGKANLDIDITHFAAGVYSLSVENQVLKVVKE